MMRFLSVAQLVCLSVVSTLSFAQDIPPAKIEKEHGWLKQFAGTWSYESKSIEGLGMPAMECKGKMESSMLGELWIINHVESNMGGMQVKAIQTIGFDSTKKKFVGTWVDSFMNHLWNYEGEVDSTGKVLTLEADGPSFAEEGKMTKFRDSYEFVTPNHIVGVSSMLGPDGKWVEFMKGNFQRPK